MTFGSVDMDLFGSSFFFFFNDTATTEIYTLSLHDALPICHQRFQQHVAGAQFKSGTSGGRSEEHTSELQSRSDLVCRLLLEKKNTTLIGPWTTSKTIVSTASTASGTVI